MARGVPASEDGKRGTDAQRAAIVKCIEAGNTVESAAASIGVNRSTIFEWQSHDPTLADLITRARDRAIERNITVIDKAAQSGNWQAAAWWLERVYPQLFGRRVAIDLNMREYAKELADQYGLDVNEVLAEADRIVSSRTG